MKEEKETPTAVTIETPVVEAANRSTGISAMEINEESVVDKSEQLVEDFVEAHAAPGESTAVNASEEHKDVPHQSVEVRDLNHTKGQFTNSFQGD